jgi:serine phosphatase RsbU (regulator of sigma subunit)
VVRRDASETLRRVERDLREAQAVQRRLLPVIPAHLPGLRIAVDYRPAFEVGGDFYDLVRLGDGRVFTVLGDVAGNGVAAALLMSRMMAEFRHAVATNPTSPASVLGCVNDAISDLEQDAFVTAACVEISPDDGRVRIANAGHLTPLVCVAPGLVAALGRSSGPPLGILSGQRCADLEFCVDPGTMLVLVTDGVTGAWEAVGRDLADTIGRLTVRGRVHPRWLASAIARIAESRDQRDDFTVLIVELVGADGAR